MISRSKFHKALCKSGFLAVGTQFWFWFKNGIVPIKLQQIFWVNGHQNGDKYDFYG